MELDKIKELIEMMDANELSELEIVDGQSRIMLKRGSTGPVITAAPLMPQAAPAPAPAVPTSEADQASAPPAADSDLLEVKSPIVGSFYSAPSPTADSFVQVGDKVTPETVVCIIEAMKVMNEIKSEVSGTIKQILCSNGDAVEFGQALFLVEP